MNKENITNDEVIFSPDTENQEECWQTDITDWENANINNVKFAYELSKQKIESDLNIKQIIEDKSFRMLSMLIPIEGILIGAFIKNYNPTLQLLKQNLCLLIPTFIALLFLFISILFFIRALCPPKEQNKYRTLGNQPKHYLKQKYINNPESQYIYYEMQHYQKKFNQHKKNNNLKMQRFRKGIYFILYSFTGSFISWLIMTIINQVLIY